MRRRLALVVAAVVTAITTALVIPMCTLTWTLEEERAISTASIQTNGALSRVMAGESAEVEGYLTHRLPGTATTVFLPDRNTFGDTGNIDSVVLATQESKQPMFFVRDHERGKIVYATAINERGTHVARTTITTAALHQSSIRTIALLILLGIILIVIAVMGTDLVVRRISNSLHRAAATAASLREGDLDARAPEEGSDEISALGRSINRLAERIGKLLASERDSVADLSHRLRTPVTALRLDTDLIADPEVAEQLRSHVTQLERTVDAIVHDARRPTRADTDRGSCDVAKIVRERVAFWSALAEEQGRPLQSSIPDRPLRAKVSDAELNDVVDVLIDNVFAHTPEGSPMEVWVAPRADGSIVVSVEDGGTGLPEGDIVSRGSSGAGSTGLGLDIARRSALASGGWLELGRSRLGGALVRVVLGAATP